MYVRTALATLAAAGLVAVLAGCGPDGDDPEPDRPAASSAAPDSAAPGLPSASAEPSAPAALPPAANAGGACRSLTFTNVQKFTGVRFEVAAATGSSGATQTCALQKVAGTVPDLAFSIIPASAEVTAELYQSDYAPSGSTKLSGVGRAGHQRIIAATATAGPRVEIGWLGKQRVYNLVLTTEKGTTPATAKQMVPKLMALGATIGA